MSSANRAVLLTLATLPIVVVSNLLASDWNIQTIGSAKMYNTRNSLSITVDGNCQPHISYYNNLDGGLMYLTKAGSSWAIQTVDTIVNPNIEPWSWSSIAIDPAGNPHIAYFDNQYWRLKYASLNSGIWNSAVVDNSAKVGYDASLAIDTTGTPHIGYSNRAFELKYATQQDGQWAINTISKNLESCGANVSLKLSPENKVLIATADAFPFRISLKSGTLNNWQSQTAADYGWSYGVESPSLAFDGQGNPYIAYWTAVIDRIKCTYWDGSQWTTMSIATADPSAKVAIAFDQENIPHFIYDTGGLVRHAYLYNDTVVSEVIGAGRINKASVAIDINDGMHVIYYNDTEGAVNYAYTVVPEPATLGLLFLGLGISLRFKKQKMYIFSINEIRQSCIYENNHSSTE